MSNITPRRTLAFRGVQGIAIKVMNPIACHFINIEKAAIEIGRRLAMLAKNVQVLVVTHSPQVAALGQHHWRVEKHVSGGTTRSTVVQLAPAERVDEIARMLSGDQITDAARHAARALLAG